MLATMHLGGNAFILLFLELVYVVCLLYTPIYTVCMVLFRHINQGLY